MITWRSSTLSRHCRHMVSNQACLVERSKIISDTTPIENRMLLTCSKNLFFHRSRTRGDWSKTTSATIAGCWRRNRTREMVWAYHLDTNRWRSGTRWPSRFYPYSWSTSTPWRKKWDKERHSPNFRTSRVRVSAQPTWRVPLLTNSYLSPNSSHKTNAACFVTSSATRGYKYLSRSSLSDTRQGQLANNPSRFKIALQWQAKRLNC